MLTPACGTTHLIVRLATDDWMMESASEKIDWVNGEPSRGITVEARLTTPPRAVCRQEIDEPAAVIHREYVVFSPALRISTAILGIGELAGGLLPLILVDGEDHSPATVTALSFLALDGLAAIILAAAVPSKARPSAEERPPDQYTLETCPTGLAFALGVETFPIMANGELLPADATYIMREIVETGMPLGLRNGEALETTQVPPDIRCAWALHLGHDAARALCPQEPRVMAIPFPVPVPMPPRRPPPPRPY